MKAFEIITKDNKISRRNFGKIFLIGAGYYVFDAFVFTHISLAVQSNWTWCKKCEGLFYGKDTRMGVCPAGGSHVNSGSANYALLRKGRDSEKGGQENWTWCKKCEGLFYGKDTRRGVCPAGGSHVNSGSANYVLLRKGRDAEKGGQENWTWCKKCEGLFYGKDTRRGVCPAGGSHVNSGSANYVILRY